MISIIICSINPAALQNIGSNIRETIGVPYEIIAIDNRVHNYGICKVYNQGGEQAQFPFICFVHEDVMFETMNWGRIVCEYLGNERTGLLGVAGGDSKSLVPSSWSIPVISNEINLVQHYKIREAPTERVLVTGNNDLTGIKKVVALDGVLLCTRKAVFNEFRFDETNFPGFHGYDIDYSLQVNTKYDNYVCFDILLHHFSEGTPDKKWVDSAIHVSNKWKRSLPVSVHNISAAQFHLHHWQSLQIFLQHQFRLQYSYPSIIRSWLAWSFTRYFSIRRFLSMGKFVFVNMVTKKEPRSR